MGYRIKSVERATGRIAYEDFALREDAISRAKKLKAEHGDKLAVFLVQPKAVSFDRRTPSGKSHSMNFLVKLYHPRTGQRSKKFFEAKKDATPYANKMAALGWTVQLENIKRGSGKKPESRSIYATRVKGIVSGGLPGSGKHR